MTVQPLHRSCELFKIKSSVQSLTSQKVFWLKNEAADATAAKSLWGFFPPLSELTLFSLETSNNCTGPKDEVKIILKQFAIKTSNCISLLAIQNLIREFCSSLPDEDLLNYTCVWQNEGDSRTAPVVGEFLSFSCDDSCWREQRETGEWEGWKVEVRSKCEQFIGLGRQCERLY